MATLNRLIKFDGVIFPFDSIHASTNPRNTFSDMIPEF